MTDRNLFGKITGNVANAANALGEKLRENFRGPSAPPTPEPPTEEIAWERGDFRLFRTYLMKGEQVVYYQNARRVHLNVVYEQPKKPGFVGRVVEGAFDYGFDGSASGAFFGGVGGSLAGLAFGSAVGAVAGATGTTPPKPEPVVLCSEKSKFSANVYYLAPLLTALKKGGAKPEIWRRGQKCRLRSVSFVHF